MDAAKNVEELMPGITIERLSGNLGVEEPQADFRQWVNFEWSGKSDEKCFAAPVCMWAKIGDGDVCPALELGLRSLRKGESGLVRCEPRFAFGAAGRPAALEGDAVLPPDSHVEFRVRVIELGVAGELGPAEQLEEGQRKRSLGNFHFQYSDFEKASRCYGAALKAIDGVLEGGEVSSDFTSQVYGLMVDAGNNLAASCLKLKQYLNAENACIAVLSVSPENHKALYRAGISAMNQTKFKEARLALEKLLSLDVDNVAAKKQLRELGRRESKYREDEKALFKTMGQSMFSESSRSAAEASPPTVAAPPPPPESNVEPEGLPPPLADQTTGMDTRNRWMLISFAVVLLTGAFYVVAFSGRSSQAAVGSQDL